MKRLMLDIETAPHKVYAWGLWDQNIALNQIVEPGYTLCWAAKWYGKKGVTFDSVHKSKPKAMLERIHTLICEADAVIHYNGTKFDMPTLNGEFLKHGLTPPPPYGQIDLLKTARKQFKLASNKLDYVAQYLEVGGKVQHKGMALWHECMEGDDKAWREMERYNKQDVLLLEDVYNAMLPWITNHPNAGMYDDSPRPICTNCGSNRVKRDGKRTNRTQVYQQFKCTECGTWMRGRKSITRQHKKDTLVPA